jgi:F-type H+-transporting ATPase subunit b
MLDLITQFGSSSSGLGSLGLNFSSFLIQLLTFIIAFLILRQWAFKPILKVMNERRQTIEKGLKLGEQMEKEKAELEQNVTKTLHETREQADSIIANAQEAARGLISEAEDKAQQRAAGIVKEAEERIAQETASARRELEQHVVGLVSDVTEAIIHEKVDPKKDAELIDRILKGRQTA